jgi:hypothetical protein
MKGRWLRTLLMAAVIALPLEGTYGHITAAADTPGAEMVLFHGTASLSPPMQWVGGTGTYTLASDVCGDVGTGPDGLPAAGVCTVTASGTYDNVVCGTGKVSGNLSVTGLETYNGSFAITLVSGQGAGLATLVNVVSGVGTVASVVATFTGNPVVGVVGACLTAVSFVAKLFIPKPRVGPNLCAYMDPFQQCPVPYPANLKLGTAIAIGFTPPGVLVGLIIRDTTVHAAVPCVGGGAPAQIAAGPFVMACNFPEIVGNGYDVLLTQIAGVNLAGSSWLVMASG